jgi:outer membrane protein
VRLDGTDIGSFKHIPPTLLAQYHFMPVASFDPYVVAGINYTNISRVKLLNGAGTLEHSSVGLALQAGIDYKIDRKWSVNFDVKKVQLRSDVFISGTKVSAVKVELQMICVGLGYQTVDLRTTRPCLYAWTATGSVIANMLIKWVQSSR